MFSHIVVGADDLAAAKHFYDAALGALGYGPGAEMGDRVIYSADTGILMVTKPFDGNRATFGTISPSIPCSSAFSLPGSVQSKYQRLPTNYVLRAVPLAAGIAGSI